MGTVDKAVAILLSVAVTVVVADSYSQWIASKIAHLAAVVAGH